jgi:hypothetical protein
MMTEPTPAPESIRPLPGDPAIVVLGVLLPPATRADIAYSAANYYQEHRPISWVTAVVAALGQADRRPTVTTLGYSQLLALYNCLTLATDRIALIKILDSVSTMPTPAMDLVATYQAAVTGHRESGAVSPDYWAGVRDTLAVLLGYTAGPEQALPGDAAAQALFDNQLSETRFNTGPSQPVAGTGGLTP